MQSGYEKSRFLTNVVLFQKQYKIGPQLCGTPIGTRRQSNYMVSLSMTVNDP